jgi:ATP-dependent DNA helicase RecG
VPGPPTNPLDAPLTTLRGVAGERAAQLARLDLRTIGDLLLHRPRRHEDRRHSRSIAQLRPGESATARGRIVAQGVKRWKAGSKSVFEFILDDGTARLHCRWWNLPFMEKYFQPGDEVFVFGKVHSLKPRTIDHPETEVVEAGEENFIHLNRVVPVYPLTEGLPQRWLRTLVWRALEEYGARIVEPWWNSKPASEPAERGAGVPPAAATGASRSTMPRGRDARADSRAGRPAEVPGAIAGMPTRAEAIRLLHFPEERDDVDIARRRLALDEFLELQLEIQRRRRKFQANAKSLPCAGDNHLIKPFLKELGFALTESQTKVLREIRRDLGGPQPMRRLLQGDVGAGKTVVAACAALMALESGFTVALMAPTEVLAEQHFETFSRWCGPLGVAVQLRTGSRKTSNVQHPTSNTERNRALDAPILNPQPATRNLLVVGTHALIESAFVPDNLGLVIIDEQHKFGVAQREKLVRKGRYPHLLVMTATPIPRTLGLTLYGDLDISVIDRGPEGRGRIMTYVRAAEKLPKVFAFIRGKLKEGRQAYVVYPRVEESDQLGIKAVTKEWERLQKEFAPYPVGLLHGRLKPEEKQGVMAAFRANRIPVLVATSVIEVGVDVPNATVMLIENAEQFGLAQLHQLRGRIGRGAHESWCVLVADLKTDEARQRLKVLEGTTDGFRVAEEDLKLRGPGELLGREQSGLPAFRFGDLRNDRDLIERARQLAAEALEGR